MTGLLIPLRLPDLTGLVQPGSDRVRGLRSRENRATSGPSCQAAGLQEAVSLVISPAAGLTPDPELSVELIRDAASAPTPRVRRLPCRLAVDRAPTRPSGGRGPLGTRHQPPGAGLAENALRTLCPGRWWTSASRPVGRRPPLRWLVSRHPRPGRCVRSRARKPESSTDWPVLSRTRRVARRSGYG